MSYFQVADELTQSELVLGVGSGVGLCITVLLVVGLWVRHAKCGQRSEVMMMVMLMIMVMVIPVLLVLGHYHHAKCGQPVLLWLRSW